MNIENVFSTRVESTTAMATSYAIYNLILPNLPYNIKVRLTTTDYINQLLERIDKLGKTTANKSREVLYGVYRQVVLDGILNNNPVETAKFYRRGKPNITILTKDEIKKLLAATCNNEQWYLEILLALFCGLRKGEINGLKYSDVDFVHRTLKVERQLGKKSNTSNSELKIGEYTKQEIIVKTFSSIREIEIPDILFEKI